VESAGSRRCAATIASVRLLILSPRECWPPNSGAKLRDFYFARGLSRGSELTYVFFGSEESAAELRANLAANANVIAVPPPVKYSPEKILRGLVGKYPLPVLNYTSPEMAGTLAALLPEHAFDLIHLDSIHFAAYLPSLRKAAPDAKVILNWHNIESELMERYTAAAPSAGRRLYAALTARQMRKLEDAMLGECFGHVVCSEREQGLLEARSGARIEVAPNGVDTAYFDPRPQRADRQRVVFVGQMSYYANAAAAEWFVKDVWPALRVQYRQLTLTIVGASPRPEVQVLSQQERVEVTGTVPDVRPFYADAYAAIVPLLTGGGTRLKILEAMAAGTPVVSTALGAEGLPVKHGRDILIADDPGSWIEAFESLADPAQRDAIVSQARELVVREFDWNAIGDNLLRLYEAWSATGS
jgi:glycosyltransferase involved in cell wall biosynthesis